MMYSVKENISGVALVAAMGVKYAKGGLNAGKIRADKKRSV